MTRESAHATVAVDDTDPARLPMPEGFTPTRRGGPWFNELGALGTHPDGRGGAVIALRVVPKHSNMSGICHGGMLATLIDGALGMNISLARGRRGGQVTVSLHCDFMSAARVGDWLEAHVWVRRLGRKMAFADGVLKVGDREVLRATAVFSLDDSLSVPLTAPGLPGTDAELSDG